MKHVTGFYPRLRVDTSRVCAVGQAGGVLLTETIRASGLDVALSAALGRWRKPTAVGDPAKVVLDLALALGGDCLADITLLGLNPASTAGSRRIRRRRARSMPWPPMSTPC